MNTEPVATIDDFCVFKHEFKRCHSSYRNFVGQYYVKYEPGFYEYLRKDLTTQAFNALNPEECFFETLSEALETIAQYLRKNEKPKPKETYRVTLDIEYDPNNKMQECPENLNFDKIINQGFQKDHRCYQKVTLIETRPKN